MYNVLISRRAFRSTGFNGYVSSSANAKIIKLAAIKASQLPCAKIEAIAKILFNQRLIFFFIHNY